MPKIKAIQVKNIKEPRRLSDGQGLFFEVSETGIRRWIYGYKIQGKSGKFTVGRYPELSPRRPVKNTRMPENSSGKEKLTLQKKEGKKAGEC